MAESNTQKVLRVLLTPAAALEAAMMAVLTQRSVNNAIGVQLTTIGKIVGRTGRNPDDEIERRLTRAQISVNKSSGLIEDILTVARLVIADPGASMELDNTGSAAYVLRVEGVAVTAAVADVLVQMVGKATSAGVGAIVGYTTGPAASRMRWGSGTWGQNWSRARSIGS